MRNVLTIYRRELATYFNSPIAYIFIVLFVAVMAFLFFVVARFFAQSEPDIRGYYSVLPWVLAVFIPAVTMRLWSEEKRAGTIELLMTMPIRSWEVVLGKFLAGYTIIALSLLLTLGVPLSIELVTDLDWGVVFTTYVGALAISGVYIALGSWVSTFTENQIVAFLISVTGALILTFLAHPGVTTFLDDLWGGLGRFIGWFGTQHHLEDFTKGLISPVGLIYALSVTSFFLVLNNVFVEGRKY